jgi:hypothetical protein
MKRVAAVLACLGGIAAVCAAQQLPAIEFAFPNQLVRGESTLVHVAIPSREMFSGAEVSPAAGVTVSSVASFKRPELSQNVAWWDVTINVAGDAAPGRRTLTLLTPTGRSTPTTIIIPAHVPRISGVSIRPVSGNQSAVNVQVAVTDPGNDIGDQPYVWFTIACGGEPTVGVVRGVRTASGGVSASIPRPAPAPCDLELRASDAQKIDSNTLKTRVP